jgi:SAM-dependent methyltransferase
MNECAAANRAHWDELVPIHVASEFYDVAGFRAGASTLKPVELAELGDVRGKTLLHLMCHFGLDTLSWAREGAIVTGIDFSERAVETARALAAETDIDARFVQSDVYALPEHLDETFDVVFASYGVVFWLPDIERWARVVAQFLRPGGTFYMVEFHPMAGVFENGAAITGLHVRYPYFPTGGPLRFDDAGTYADRSVTLKNPVTYSWPHPVGEVVTALVDAGLRIEFFHEFPFSTERWFPFMEEVAPHTFHLAEHDGSVPFLYSVKATKPPENTTV